jgi:hypothetical protein
LQYDQQLTRSNHIALLYKEFGENIKHLAANLTYLQRVIEAINVDGIPQSTDSVYVAQLWGIIGNYQMTLQDCEKLLRDNARFSWQGGFIRSVVWNFRVEPDVQDLKDRLAFLNIKISTVLKTLDLRMAHQLQKGIFRIHRDLASRIDGAHEDIIQEIQDLRSIILKHPNAVDSSSRPRTAPFDIPASLESLFEQQIQSLDIHGSQLRLVHGLDAVVYHINAATTIPINNTESKRERQWLKLAKAFWIITKVRAGQECVLFACCILCMLALELAS